MIKTLHRWLLLATIPFVLATCNPAIACPPPIRTYELARDYGVDNTHDHTLAEHGYTYADAKAKFQHWVGWCEYKGWSQAEVLNVYEATAANNDACWKSQGYFSETPYPDYSRLLQARCNVIWDHGYYRESYPSIVPQGHLIGQGASNYHGIDGMGRPQTTGGTCVAIDHNKWLKNRSPERFCFITSTWGSNDGLAYAEAYLIEGFLVDGNRGPGYDPSYLSAGFGMWDSGEASEIRNCYAQNFNSYGFLFVRSTPVHGSSLSSFCNWLAGFAFLGTDLSTGEFDMCSADDNGVGILGRDGYGRPGGGTFTFNGGKWECGKRQPYQQMTIVDWRGACNLTCTGFSVDATTSPANAFVFDFQGFNAQVTLTNWRLRGYGAAGTFTAKGVTTRIKYPGDVTPFTAVFTELGIGPRPLQTEGASPPPSSCSWVLGTPGAWSACVNGSQTRTTAYIASPSGCTPTSAKPADLVEMAACSAGGSTTVWSGGTVTAGTKVHLQAPVVAREVVVTNLKTTTFAYGRLLGTGENLPSIQLYPDGFFYFNGQKVSTAKVQSNVAWSGTLKMPSPYPAFTDVWQTDPKQAGAIPCTCDKIVITQ
jgi:hypothetical protein